MDYLENHDRVTNRIARELTGIEKENTMKEVFYRLAKRDLIERMPGLKGAAAAWKKSGYFDRRFLAAFRAISFRRSGDRLAEVWLALPLHTAVPVAQTLARRQRLSQSAA